MKTTTAYKVFTHDLCSPVRGGASVWDGKLPYTLPVVEVNQSKDTCAAGWNACKNQHDALRIAGLWPNGWPSRLFKVTTTSEVIERDDKLRAASWDIVEEITDLKPAIHELSKAFGEHQNIMVQEQLAWREALGRPNRNKSEVIKGLELALKTRGLNWKLKEYQIPSVIWAASAAWDDWAAWEAWDARDVWAARDARVAWEAWAIRDAWIARAARAARDARAASVPSAAWDAKNARDAWDAKNARDALVLFFASSNGWLDYDKHHLTKGIREAYKNGLAIAVPTSSEELGWAMINEAGK